MMAEKKTDTLEETVEVKESNPAESVPSDTSSSKSTVTSITKADLDESNITKERIFALIRAICILVTSVAAFFGAQWNADEMFQVVSCVLAVASIAWGYWKNNNWTDLAVGVQAILDAIRQESKTK